MEFGFLSLLPIVVVLLLAFVCRNVLIALLGGLLTGFMVLSARADGLLLSVGCITDVVTSSWSLKSIIFCLLIGAFVFIIEASGGVGGIVDYLNVQKQIIKSPFAAELLAFTVGILLFLDGISSIVISGVASRAFFDVLDVPRHRLAYIIDSTSSPVAWLIPINGAGAFLVAMLSGQVSAGVLHGDVFVYIIDAVFFQLYSVFSILAVAISIIFRNNKKHYYSVNHISLHQFKTDIPKNKGSKAYNIVIPLLVLVISNIIYLLISGNGNLSKGDASSSLLFSVLFVLFFSSIFYYLQGIVSIVKYLKWCVKGIISFMQIIFIFALSFALSNLIQQLDTGSYIAGICVEVESAFLPVLVFLVGVLISFSTGTSSGTIAILIPLSMPLAVNLGVDIPIVIGAIISSAVFGDHCSPISDSTILSAMIAEISVMEHVKTQWLLLLPMGIIPMLELLM